jgi:hypothetical protein
MPPDTAQTFHTEDMAPNLSRNQRRSKRRRAAKGQDDDGNEQQQHASKRVKFASRASTLTPLTWQGVANRSFSEPPHQLALLDWDDFEMGTSGPTAPNSTQTMQPSTKKKRKRPTKTRDEDNDEQPRKASKRAKLASWASARMPLTEQETANRSFPAPPHQLAPLDWDDFEVVTCTSGLVPRSFNAKIEPQKSGPHNLRLPSEDVSHPDEVDIDPSETPTSSRNVNSTFKEDARYWNETACRWKYRNLPSGDSSMLHSDDDMDVDPPETLTLRQDVNSVSDEVERYGNETAREWKAEMTDQNLPSYGSPQNAGDQKSHKSPLRSAPRKDIDAASELPASSVGLLDLPDDLLDRIFTILLKSDDEVTFNASWLMTVVNSAAHGPSVLVNSSSNPKQHHTLKTASVLREDLKRINASLKAIPNDKWPRNFRRSQTGILTRSLLTVSKAVQERAARIFYGSNTFNFSHQKTCWMHLESFLATVGHKNASHIRHIRILAPEWDPGLRRDAIMGALFDAMAPVTRLAGFTVPAEDRLLSAIKTCVDVLGVPGNLESLQLDVMYQHNAVSFIDRSKARSFPVLADEAAYHEQRREVGRQLFKRWSDTSFGPANKPRLVAHAASNVTLLGASGFRRLLPSMTREAGRYGWVVDQYLRWSERDA